jgi:hypothetical protein
MCSKTLKRERGLIIGWRGYPGTNCVHGTSPINQTKSSTGRFDRPEIASRGRPSSDSRSFLKLETLFEETERSSQADPGHNKSFLDGLSFFECRKHREAYLHDALLVNRLEVVIRPGLAPWTRGALGSWVEKCVRPTTREVFPSTGNLREWTSIPGRVTAVSLLLRLPARRAHANARNCGSESGELL